MGSNSILLIEDDQNLRSSFTLILQRAGYFVTSIDCIYKSRDLIRDGGYQLVISDLNMPEAQKMLIPTVLNSSPAISLVLLTDHSVTESEKEGKPLSAYYLEKPVAPERLLDCIEMVIGKSNHPLQQ